ncbi:MAG TPA: hypothetical protein VNG33_06995 [Polyangiaceae bacterium]|nr:hypothetical protein [Polyangiaceae bacterium]
MTTGTNPPRVLHAPPALLAPARPAPRSSRTRLAHAHALALTLALPLALALSSSLYASVASAQSRDPAAAEALFREGRSLSDAGDIAGACAKFRESDRLDPAVGTTFNIADCEERLGHVATAWTLFDEVAQRLPAADKRRAVSQKRAAALEPRLPKLSVKLAAGAPDGTRVTRDGVELGPASLGTPLPIDPGEHVVVVSAPGRAERPFKLIVSEREIRALEVAPAEPSAAPVETKPKEPQQPLGPAPAAEQHGSRTLGYVLGGVGIAGFITGGIAGALVLQKKGVVNTHCNADKRCDDEGLAATRSGKTLGIVTTAGLITGVVGVGAGTYVILSAGSRESPTSASIAVSGRF